MFSQKSYPLLVLHKYQFKGFKFVGRRWDTVNQDLLASQLFGEF